MEEEPVSGYDQTTIANTSGGGGTDIRLFTDSLYARVIVAGGGGGGGQGWYEVSHGGAGGGTNGEDSPGMITTDYIGVYPGGGGGTQTQGGTVYSTNLGKAGTFGIGGSHTHSGHDNNQACGGGGGWYRWRCWRCNR